MANSLPGSRITRTPPRDNWWKTQLRLPPIGPTPDRRRYDWEISEIVPGSGKYAGSAGAIQVRHPITGARSELGSLAIADAERQWIWDHRAELERQAVAKFEAMEITDAGAVRSGTFTGLHQAKGSELALQIIGKHQLGR